MSPWLVVFSTSGRTLSVTLPLGRSTLVGGAAGATVEIAQAGLADRHLSLVPRDEGVLLEPLRGAGEVVVNDVPVPGQLLLRPGDELRTAALTMVLLPRAVPAARVSTVVEEHELMTRLADELQRAGTLRPVGLALISSPGLNVAARQALARRVMEELQRAEVSATFARLTPDVLAIVVAEVPSAALTALFGRITSAAGMRATVACVRSPDDALDAERLLEVAWASLRPSPPEPPLFAGPSTIRLVALLERLVGTGKSVCVTGAAGSGRATALEAALREQGHRVEVVSSFDAQAMAKARASGATLVLRELDRLDAATQREVGRSQPGPLYATARQPLPGFEHAVPWPALVERRDELVALAEHFVDVARAWSNRPRLTLSPEARSMLLGYPWPGQLSELKNVLWRASVVTARDELGGDALPERLQGDAPAQDYRTAMEASERSLLLEVLARTRWNVSAAALRLGLPRRTIVHRLRKLGLKRPTRSA